MVISLKLTMFCALVAATLAFMFAPVPYVVADEVSGVPDTVGVRIIDAPPKLAGDPRANLYIIDHVPPGTHLDRRIEVSTTADSPLPIELYTAAATVDGGIFIGAGGRTPNELSTWISVSPTSLSIPARGVQMAMVTINVPSDAAPGERYAVVWVEARAPADTGSGVRMVSRVGVRVYLSVGSGGPPAADFVIESLTADRLADGTPIVIATVRNTGGRALDLSGALTLRNGPAGLEAGPYPAQLGITLGIADSAPVTIELDPRLPSGPWDAELTLASGLDERTVRDVLTFPGSGQEDAVDSKRAMPSWIMPVLSLFIVSLLACIAGLAWLVVRRRRPTSPR